MIISSLTVFWTMIVKMTRKIIDLILVLLVKKDLLLKSMMILLSMVVMSCLTITHKWNLW